MLCRPLLFLSIVFAAVLPALPAVAQANLYNNTSPMYGFQFNLTGEVHDMAGHPITGAHIDLVDVRSGRTVATGRSFANGDFEITSIPQGQYEIVASAGINESRTRMDVDSDREVSIRLPINTNVADSGGATVSLSQMKVPGKARRLLQKAEKAFQNSHLDDALGFVQQALGVYPDYAKALTLRGILNMERGDVKQAQPDLEKAIQLDYGNGLSYVALASLYNGRQEYDQALQVLQQGISLNPKSWQANMEMARAQLGKNDFGAAIRSLDRAQSSAPPEVTIMYMYRAQALIGLKEYGGAINQLETYLAKSPTGTESASARNALVRLRELTASGRK